VYVKKRDTLTPVLALKGRMLPRPDSPFSQVPKAFSILVSLSWGASTPFFRNGMWAFLKQSPMTQPLFLCKSVLPFLFFELTKASGFLKRPICVCLRSCLAGQFIRSCYLGPSTKHSLFYGNKVGVGNDKWSNESKRSGCSYIICMRHLAPANESI